MGCRTGASTGCAVEQIKLREDAVRRRCPVLVGLLFAAGIAVCGGCANLGVSSAPRLPWTYDNLVAGNVASTSHDGLSRPGGQGKTQNVRPAGLESADDNLILLPAPGGELADDSLAATQWAAASGRRYRRTQRPRFAAAAGVPHELDMASHPLYVVEPPDVLYIEAQQLLAGRPVLGERLVRQDGTISLGYYGQVHVAGLTLEEIEEKIRRHLSHYTQEPQVYVDVASFNSKVYYVLGQVQQTGRLPVTGKETVLDALTLAGGLTNYAKLRGVYVVRPSEEGERVLRVDYRAIVDRGDVRTNYQLMPGDRVVVQGTKGFRTSVFFDNFLTPIERVSSLFSLYRFTLD
jgi:polysaccharide export outer membrane protein